MVLDSFGDAQTDEHDSAQSNHAWMIDEKHGLKREEKKASHRVYWKRNNDR